MKIAYRLFLFLLISAFLFSCSEKKAGIEGKLLDGRGQPISGITVIFKQVQASKGYEQFETKTLANGVFRIDGVMPSSEYIITPASDNWKTKMTTKITTLAEGQTLVLSTPLVIRFNSLRDGTVADTKTGLQWLILGITDLNSTNILYSVKNINQGGFTDWRLPTKAELLQLQETQAAPITQPETGLSQKTCCTWVAELNSENVEWKFYVDDGNDVWASSKVPPDDRIVVVRNYIPAASAPPASGTLAPSTQTPAAPLTQTPAVSATPTSGNVAPSAILPAEKKPVPEPAAVLIKKKDIPAVGPPAHVMEKKDIPAVFKSEDGVLRASRKACLANKGQPAKSPATAAAEVAASPAKQSPSFKSRATATPEIAAPAKQSPSARVKTPAQPDSIGNSITIQFDMNKTIISPEELSKLKAFYAKIKGKKGRIVIEGNSDGDTADNFKISGDRALSVKSMLHKLGLSKKVDVKIVGLSDTKPIYENTTEAGRILNRRADITFIPGSPATAAPSVAASPAKQLPSAIVTTPPVKSEGGVLRASRKACSAKKVQTGK